jgi:hypothetical protein
MTLNLVAIIADAVMILLLAVNRTSYFRPYRNYFVSIYAAFLIFPIRDLLMMNISDALILRLSTNAMVGGAVAIALLWGYLSTKLYKYPKRFSLRSAIQGPVRSIQFMFLLYTLPMAVAITASFLPGAIESTPVDATYVFSAAKSNVVGFSLEFLAIAASVVVAFTAYPLTVLASLRSQLRDPEVRYALKIIASCFGMISGLMLTVNALDTFHISISGAGNLVSVSLLIIADRAFSRPSFLKAFLGVVPPIESLNRNRRADIRGLIYRKEDEKFTPIVKFVSEGLNQGSLVAYFYRGDASTIWEGLARHGYNARQYPANTSLQLIPFGTLYQADSGLYGEVALGIVSKLAEEAMVLGRHSLKLVVDYGQFSPKPFENFVNHLSDPRWTNVGHYVGVLMTFSAAMFEGQENALALLSSKIETSELSDMVDSFSRSIGFSHSQIAGKKILLEYEPSSDYERILKSLLLESASNFERAALFTRRDSPIYALLSEQAGAKVFVLTSRVSYPRLEEGDRVLLPAYESALLLDALNKTIQAYAGASVIIVFDSVSHNIFTLGPDKALSVVRQAMELMISDKVTVVFLMNIAAHDPKTISTFESIFDLAVVCRAGARIPDVKRRLNVAQER